MTLKHRLAAAAFALGVALPAGPAVANPTKAQIALLPVYCQARLGTRQNSPEQRYWSQKMGGDNYIHLHHFCGGLAALAEAYGAARDRNKRTIALKGAMWEWDYVETNWPEDFVLMPEVHYNRGRTLLLMGERQAAFNSFMQAIRLRPDYVDPYAAASDLLVENKQYDKAREVLSKGLEAVPEHKKLVLRMNELDALPAHKP